MNNPSTTRIIETHNAVQKAYRKYTEIYDSALPQLQGDESATLEDARRLALLLKVRCQKIMDAAALARLAALGFCVAAERALYAEEISPEKS